MELASLWMHRNNLRFTSFLRHRADYNVTLFPLENAHFISDWTRDAACVACCEERCSVRISRTVVSAHCSLLCWLCWLDAAHGCGCARGEGLKPNQAPHTAHPF